MSVRRVGVLALHLPPDAAIYRIGPDDEVWSREVQTLVTLMDVIRKIVDKDAPLLPRPGDVAREEKRVDRILAKAERWLRRQVNN